MPMAKVQYFPALALLLSGCCTHDVLKVHELDITNSVGTTVVKISAANAFGGVGGQIQVFDDQGLPAASILIPVQGSPAVALYTHWGNPTVLLQASKMGSNLEMWDQDGLYSPVDLNSIGAGALVLEGGNGTPNSLARIVAINGSAYSDMIAGSPATTTSPAQSGTVHLQALPGLSEISAADSGGTTTIRGLSATLQHLPPPPTPAPLLPSGTGGSPAHIPVATPPAAAGTTPTSH
jgi:hypothetical protein